MEIVITRARRARNIPRVYSSRMNTFSRSGAAWRATTKAAGLLLLLLWPVTAAADPGWYPDRRRTQFQTDPGHVAVPYLFNLPGIGWGYGLLGGATNIGGTCADLSGSVFAGDVSGTYLAVDQIHLIPRRLILDLGGAYLNRAAIESYNQRGMGSDRDDYLIAEFKNMRQGGFRSTATFLDRRLEAFIGYYAGSVQLAAVRDREGEVIVEAEDAPSERSHTWIYGARLDFTDDAMDPRRGLRCEASLWRSPPGDSGPDYYLTDYSVSAYMPIGGRSTWAFNYFHSDAHVLREGETDPAVIAEERGLDCGSIDDPLERGECERFIDTIVAENRYGSASSLGGVSRLRAYPEGRFRGAHSRLIGTELRWNLTDEMTPFNIYIMKDIRTAFQVAFFYELGTVADRERDLWSSTRSSYGAGFRLVTASGVVYRVDLALGEEGFVPSVFFMYPWEF